MSSHCYFTSTKNPMKHNLVLDLKSNPRETYDPKFMSRTNLHVGQRKLLLSEVQLLIEHYKSSKEHPVILYIGAAPGTKNVILAKMFPHVKFVLYDGATFDRKLKEPKYKDVFELHEGKDGFFTNELCAEIVKSKRFDGKPLLFVSDIRLGEGEFELGVAENMQQQMEWVQMLKPDMSLLKFRLPYTMKHGDKLKYMKGTVFFGVWAKPQSGETRLLVRKQDVNRMVSYDFKAYEQSMVFQNKYARPYCYAKDAIPYTKFVGKPYCLCFDCIAELKIIDEYISLGEDWCYKDMESVTKLIGPLPTRKHGQRPGNLLINIDNYIAPRVQESKSASTKR